MAVLLLGNATSLGGYRGWLARSIPVALVLLGWISRSWFLRRKSQAEKRNPPAILWVIGASGLALLIPMLILPTPMDTDAQGFGYLSLAIRQGKNLTSLAPWHPEVTILYPPGALLTFAALSDLLPSVPMSAIMMGSTHALTLLFVLLSGALGIELAHQSGRSSANDGPRDGSTHVYRWGLIASIAGSLSVGLWTALLDSHYTAIFGLTFSLAFFLYTLRFVRLGRAADAVLAALFLAACWMTHVDTALMTIIGLGSMLMIWPLAHDRPVALRWMVLAIGVPALSCLMISPWIVRIAPLLESGIRSPFHASWSNWRPLIVYQGVLWPVVGAIGMFLSGRRHLWALSMTGWLGALVCLSLVDAGSFLSGTPLDHLWRFAYPFSFAWHGPIIPLLALSTPALARIIQRIEADTLITGIHRLALGVSALIMIGALAARPLLQLSRNFVGIYGSLSSWNDVRAMRWIQAHTKADARVLNYPGDFDLGRDWEAAWAPVISERDCVYFRWQPFFLVKGVAPGERGPLGVEQAALVAFWRDPTDPANLSRFEEAGIDYVLVPELVADPAARQRAWRWRQPELLSGATEPAASAPYLHLVFQAGGARVLEFSP